MYGDSERQVRPDRPRFAKYVQCWGGIGGLSGRVGMGLDP